MATKKACILHTPQKKAEAEDVAERLRGDGYQTCVTGVSSQTAQSVQAGDMSTLPSTRTIETSETVIPKSSRKLLSIGLMLLQEVGAVGR